LSSSVAAPGPSTAAVAPETDAAFGKFVASLKAMGFFDGVEEGTPEHNDLMDSARAKFRLRGSGSGSSSSDSTAALSSLAAGASTANDEAGAEAAKARGNEHHSAGRNREAIECYSEAISLAPTGKSAHIYLANRSAAKASLRDFDGAIADAEASIKANPSWPKAHGRLGTALQLAGRHAAAVPAFEEALRLDPGNEAARSNLAAARAAVAAAAGAGGGAGGSGGGGARVAGRAGPPGGNPLAGLAAGLGGSGGLAGLMQNPMLQSMMSNPAMMSMAQQMMSNPQAMQQMMAGLGGAGGLAGLSQMMAGLGAGGGGSGGGSDDLGDAGDLPSLEEQ